MILQSKFVIMILDFFGHATYQDLVKQINNGTKRLNVNKLIQISMDGRSLNHKFFEEVSKERKGDEQHQLINIVSCGLRTICIAFKTGAENAKWNIKQTLKGTFQVFHDSPARRDDFESVTRTKVYSLFYVTR